MPRGNVQNLVHYAKGSEEARKNGKKGAVASIEARQQRRDLKESLNALLENDYTDKKGQTKSGAQMIAAKLFDKALKGDVKAFEILRDTAGQKPVEKIIHSNVSLETAEEVNQFLHDDGKAEADPK